MLAFYSQGGGVFVDSNAEATLQNCEIKSNRGNNVSTQFCTFPALFFQRPAGTLHNPWQGGGVAVSTGGYASFMTCTITANTAKYDVALAI